MTVRLWGVVACSACGAEHATDATKEEALAAVHVRHAAHRAGWVTVYRHGDAWPVDWCPACQPQAAPVPLSGRTGTSEKEATDGVG